ncbi:DUF4124 domain-containing protein [Thermomonas flagellata]|uniref:DUF4124 domain-containing protein n=1 Tax=Thermomonas flagellata TaxID=2888524 RepID=UPI001F0344F9|nr:DUF4124 domain-containing protein [Thermomonas flagellata]
MLVSCTHITGLLLLLAAAGASLSAHAGEAYRCVARDGSVHWQDHACPPASRQDRLHTYADPPVPVAPTQAATHDRAAPAATKRHARRAHGSPARMLVSRRTAMAMTRDARCRAAKAWRAQEAERLGLRRTYADLGRLDAPVRAACNGY